MTRFPWKVAVNGLVETWLPEATPRLMVIRSNMIPVVGDWLLLLVSTAYWFWLLVKLWYLVLFCCSKPRFLMPGSKSSLEKRSSETASSFGTYPFLPLVSKPLWTSSCFDSLESDLQQGMQFNLDTWWLFIPCCPIAHLGKAHYNNPSSLTFMSPVLHTLGNHH